MRSLETLTGWLFFLCVAMTVRCEAQPDILLSGHYPPMMIDRAADRPGYSNELVLLAAQRLGRPIELRFKPFNRCLKELETGQNTMQAALFRTAPREDRFRWLVKTHAEEVVFASLTTSVNSLVEARTLTDIVVERGSAVNNLLDLHAFTNLTRTSDPRQSATILRKGRIRVWGTPRSTAHWIWAENAFREPLHFGQPLETQDVYVVTGLGFPADVARAYQEMISTLIAEGEFERLRRKYEQAGTGIIETNAQAGSSQREPTRTD